MMSSNNSLVHQRLNAALDDFNTCDFTINYHHRKQYSVEANVKQDIQIIEGTNFLY